MKILKGIGIYTLIVLGSITLLGLILMGAMFIFPKFGLFGYNFQYKSFEETAFENLKISTVETDSKKIDKSTPIVNLYINNANYNMYLLPGDSAGVIKSYVSSNYIGFVKTESGVFETSMETSAYVQTNDDGINELNVIMNINEPKGAVTFREDNKLFVYVPYLLSKGGEEVVYNVFAKSDGGDVNIVNSEDKGAINKKFVANKVSIETNDGDINLKGFALLNSSKKVEATSDSDTAINLESLKINTKGGVVDLTNFSKITVEEKVVLISTRADYKFKNLVAKKGIEVVGSNVRFEAEEVNAQLNGFIYKSTTGGLDVNRLNCSNLTFAGGFYSAQGNLPVNVDNGVWQGALKNYEATIITESAQIDIDELIGKFGIENEYGNITIKHCTNQGSIRNAHGNVTIETSGYYNDANANTDKRVYSASSSLIIYNEYGNIKVGKYYQNGVFTTDKGDIEANSVYHTLNGDNHYFSKIQTRDGDITFESTANACSVITTGKGNITAKIQTVTKNAATDWLTFENEDKVNYGFKVNTGKLSITLPSAQASYNVKATGKISGYITTNSPIESDKLAQICYTSTNKPTQSNIELVPYVRLLGGTIAVKGDY